MAAAPPPSSSDALALVPFSLASPFADPLRLPSRRISIGCHTFCFRQAWAPDGRGGTGNAATGEYGFGASIYPAAICLAHHLIVAAPHLVAG